MTEDFNEQHEAEKLSKINSAGLINLRIHVILNDANKHARTGEFALWNADLDRFWCELSLPEGHAKVKGFEDIQKELAKVGPIQNWKVSAGFEQMQVDGDEKKTKQYNALIKKELFLRRLQDKTGMGKAYEESEDDWE